MYEVHRIDAYTDFPVNVTVRSGVRKTCGSTFHWQVLHICWPAPTVVVEAKNLDKRSLVEGIGLHVEDTLVSLVLSIIISWTFRMLTHEENQYSYVYKILCYFFCLKH